MLVCLPGSPQATDAGADTYNVARDFSIKKNPNGPWSYGYFPRGGTFKLYAQPTVEDNGFKHWHIQDVFVGPDVLYNGGDDYAKGDVLLPAGSFSMHPGPNGEATVARLTAPDAGEYRVDAVFAMADGTDDDCFTHVDVSVRLNSRNLMSREVNAKAKRQAFGSSLILTEGDRIDFVVAPGADYFCDRTLLNARLTRTGDGPAVLTHSTDTRDVSVAAQGNNVYAVWAEDGVARPDTYIALAISRDGGSTWEKRRLIYPLPLFESGRPSRLQLKPDVSVDGSNVYIAFLTFRDNAPVKQYYTVWVSTSTNGGRTFGKPESLETIEGVLRTPSVAAADDLAHVAYYDLIHRSNAWSVPAASIAKLFGRAPEQVGVIATEAAATTNFVAVPFIAISPGGNGIYITRSLDGGARGSFTDPREQRVGDLPAGSTTRWSLDAAALGSSLALTWRDGQRLVSRMSTDRGGTFGPLTKAVSLPPFSDPLYWDTALGRGSLWIAWSANRSVVNLLQLEDGKAVGPATSVASGANAGRQGVALAVVNDGLVVVWTEKAGGEMVVKTRVMPFE